MPAELWLVSLAGLALAWKKDRAGFFLFRGGFREVLVEGLVLLTALAVAVTAYHYGRAWLPPLSPFQAPAKPFALLARIVIFESLLLGLLDRMRLAAVPKFMRGTPLRLLLTALMALVLWGVLF